MANGGGGNSVLMVTPAWCEVPPSPAAVTATADAGRTAHVEPAPFPMADFGLSAKLPIPSADPKYVPIGENFRAKFDVRCTKRVAMGGDSKWTMTVRSQEAVGSAPPATLDVAYKQKLTQLTQRLKIEFQAKASLTKMMEEMNKADGSPISKMFADTGVFAVWQTSAATEYRAGVGWDPDGCIMHFAVKVLFDETTGALRLLGDRYIDVYVRLGLSWEGWRTLLQRLLRTATARKVVVRIAEWLAPLGRRRTLVLLGELIGEVAEYANIFGLIIYVIELQFQVMVSIEVSRAAAVREYAAFTLGWNLVRRAYGKPVDLSVIDNGQHDAARRQAIAWVDYHVRGQEDRRVALQSAMIYLAFDVGGDHAAEGSDVLAEQVGRVFQQSVAEGRSAEIVSERLFAISQEIRRAAAGDEQ